MKLYRIYAGDDSGGEIDYSTPIAEVPGLSFDTDPLPLDSRTRFGVRVYDDVTGLEERNVDAVVEIVVDGAGLDATGRPGSPLDLSVRPTAGGTAVVLWSYNRLSGGGIPASFKVWLTAGTSVNYAAAPAATVPYDGSARQFAATLSGLADGTTYAVGVRAANASGDDPNTQSALVVGDEVGPDAVDDLAAEAV